MKQQTREKEHIYTTKRKYLTNKFRRNKKEEEVCMRADF